MLEHLEKTWDRCLCEARRRLWDERLAARQESDPYPDQPTDEEAHALAQELFQDSRASAMRIAQGSHKMW